MRTVLLLTLLFSTVALIDAHASDDLSVDDRLQRALADGLPTASLEAKIAEGLAKGVPPARLVAVIDRWTISLQTVRDLLPGGAPPPLIEAAAHADRSGISAASIIGLASGARASDTLQLAGDLVQQGLAADDAAALARTSMSKSDVRAADVVLAASMLAASKMTSAEVSLRLTRVVAAGDQPLAAVNAASGGPGNSDGKSKGKGGGVGGGNPNNGNNGNRGK